MFILNSTYVEYVYCICIYYILVKITGYISEFFFCQKNICVRYIFPFFSTIFFQSESAKNWFRKAIVCYLFPMKKNSIVLFFTRANFVKMKTDWSRKNTAFTYFCIPKNFFTFLVLHILKFFTLSDCRNTCLKDTYILRYI